MPKSPLHKPDEGIRSKNIVDPKALNSIIEKQVKKATSYKGKEVGVHMIDKMPKGPRGIVSNYIASNARPY